MSSLSDAAVERLRSILSGEDPGLSRYRVVREISRGGMGTVFVAIDELLGREVALKIINPEIEDPVTLGRIEREAKALARLEHPAIIPVHDAGRLADGRFFYVMKLVRGRPLDEAMRELSLAELLRIFARICEAMAFAHSRGVVHRDLKPSNVLVGEFGEVLVADWGIARITEDPERSGEREQFPDRAFDTGVGQALGTPGFMAPEQQRGDGSVIDERTDVFALGVTLREIARFAGSRSRRKPRALEAIATRASSPEPDDRYQSVASLAEDVRNFQDDRPVSAYRAPLGERFEKWAYRNRAAIAVIAAYMIMRLILFAFF